ncbi:MAG: Eco57I restriction-modification methylase domain-containing protein [Methylocella sp.]
MTGPAFQGSLFSVDFFQETIAKLPDWSAVDDGALDAFARDFKQIFDRFPTAQTPNESQTEDDLIWLVLSRLGWAQSLRNQNLSARGRDDVPDGLLFENQDAKARANTFPEEWKRYQFGRAIVESKRWLRPLDRQSGARGEETAPSTQMLRYLRRVDDLTTGKLRWGILTNGARWRLYYQGARSVSEQFFEIDLAAALAISGHDGGLFALPDDSRRHCLKVFILVFRREAFLPSADGVATFHQRAIEEGRFYEERVAGNLSRLVFGFIFPALAQAIAAAAPDASLHEVRDAALILLYRLLFILYAEDRGLLPVSDRRYEDYGLRIRVREDIRRRKDRNDAFSETAAHYWSTLDDLCRAINEGDRSIGLPPYNGGLFDPGRTPLLTQIRLGDAVMANVIDQLSFEKSDLGRKYINYRDLSVQQLGSIYERLVEHEVSRDGAGIVIRPNVFARKGSGSYYTPDDLVGLIIRETVEPLVTARMEAFEAKARELEKKREAADRRLKTLEEIDPARRLLDLKICDPAMGSGHFLVSLVDYLADRVITAIAEARAAVTFGTYVSPLIDRIAEIRATILRNAEERGWTIDPDHLDDRHIIRRMVLKRCIYGVDKNAMAVELAKVSLWLHTFTVGAPLSFLDHHLRCGDSLFGSWVRGGIDRAAALGAPLFLHEPMTRAMRAAVSMQMIENLTDAEIAEARHSKEIFDEVCAMTAPLDAILSLIHALDWLDLNSQEDRSAVREFSRPGSNPDQAVPRPVAVRAFLSGQFGDPVRVALGKEKIAERAPGAARFAEIFAQARELVAEEKFLNWQVAFPGVWSNWDSAELSGGFDAVIGNPPWDRIKLQEVEWWAARRPEVARAETAAKRKGLIKALEAANDPLVGDFEKAVDRADATSRTARKSGEYPFLSGGDTNLNSLFIERAHALTKRSGLVGLLVPSGIASDQSSAAFFRKMTQGGQLRSVIDFFNKRSDGTLFFPDVYYRFKFCAYIANGPARKSPVISFGFFIRNMEELRDPDRLFVIAPEDIALINPNSGTAPIFRSRRDLGLTRAIYSNNTVLVDRSVTPPVSIWPVRYSTMFHMANDSGLFLNPSALEKAGAYPVGQNVWKKGHEEFLPLYEGKMVQAFDHRASDILLADGNLFRTGQGRDLSLEEHKDPDRVPVPRYWIDSGKLDWAPATKWCLAIKDVTSVTNARTTIAAAIPRVGAGHTLPVIFPKTVGDKSYPELAALLLANLNSMALDYLARQKVHGNHLAWYLVEQLAVVPPDRYEAVRFGKSTAADIIRAAVLELTYTAHDMAPFARDMGYVDKKGKVKPPFAWDEDRRLKLRAKLDAVYFHLYGVTKRDDVRYIYSTFPIVEREEMNAFSRYRSRDLCLAYMSALAAGDPDVEIDL